MSKAQSQTSRRGVMAALGLATTAVASLVVARKSGPEVAAVVPEAPPAQLPKAGGGYSESEHVKRYYKTTLV